MTFSVTDLSKNKQGIKQVFEFEFDLTNNAVSLVTYKEIKVHDSSLVKHELSNFDGVLKYRTCLIDDMSQIKVPTAVKDRVKRRLIESIHFNF